MIFRSIRIPHSHSAFRIPHSLMLDYAEPVTKLIDEFKRLPGIGHKSAQRLAFHVLKAPQEEADRLVEAIREVRRKSSSVRPATT